MGYGVNFPDMSRGAAVFADKILKGAESGGVPSEIQAGHHTVMQRTMRCGSKVGSTDFDDVCH
jgi:hypothetical protein